MSCLLVSSSRKEIAWQPFSKSGIRSRTTSVLLTRKYLDRALSGELEGREVRVTVEEVALAAEKAFSVLKSAYAAGP